jgi:hypothetical protein
VGDGVADGVGAGVGVHVSLGVGEGVGVGVAEGVGDCFFSYPGRCGSRVHFFSSGFHVAAILPYNSGCV